MSFELSLKKVTTSTLPAASDVVTAGRELIESVPTWKAHKKTHQVQSYSKKTKEAFAWHARVSHHTPEEVTFDDLWDALGVDHYNKEVQYIDALKRVEKLKDTELGEVWALHYTFPPPVSPRVFTQLLLKHLDDSDPAHRVGHLIQLPFDVEGDEALIALQGHGVKGTYVSVEQIREGDDGKLEWRMATCSTPGGSIPAWLSERSIPGEIMKDVPAVITWIHKHKTAATEAT